MSLAFLDSFDHYDSDKVGSKWTWQNAAAITTGGRTGNCLSLFNSDSFVSVTLYSSPGWTVGFGLKWQGGGGGGWQTQAVFSGYDNLLTLCGVSVNEDGTMSIISNSGVGGTSDVVLRNGQWDYYECQVAFSEGTYGGNPSITYTATLRQNGVQILAATGNSNLNPNGTLYNAAASNAHGLFNDTGTGMYFDDFYIRDNSGSSSFNSFAGNLTGGKFYLRLGCIYPIADLTTGWAPSAGSNLFSLVNIHPPLGDDSYIDSSTLNQVAAFSMAPPSSGAQVLGVQMVMYGRKSDEGSRNIDGMLNSAPLDVPFYMSDSYTFHTIPLDTIDGTHPFTSANIASSSWGVKVVTG